MTDDIDNDGTTLHESGGVVQPTDAQIEDILNKWSSVEYTTERVIKELRALLALAVPQAPLQAEPVPVVASDSHVRAVLLSYHSNNLTEDEAVRLLATPQAEPAVAEQAREELETRLRSMSRTLANIASDPMWSDHAEISKRTLNRASEVMTLALSALASQSTPPPESAGQGLSDAEIHRIAEATFRDYLEDRNDDADVAFAHAILAANRTAQPDGGSKA